MFMRNVQNVQLRRYGSLFEDTFGMLPLTYFGAIGDNHTDNYANIQVAINECVKRGLKYIFVPKGNYFYTGNLLDVDKVTFVANTNVRIYNRSTSIPTVPMITDLSYITGTTTIKDVSIPNPETKAIRPIYLDKSYVGEVYITFQGHVIHVIDKVMATIDGQDIESANFELFDGLYIRKVAIANHEIDTPMGIFTNAIEITLGADSSRESTEGQISMKWGAR